MLEFHILATYERHLTNNGKEGLNICCSFTSLESYQIWNRLVIVRTLGDFHSGGRPDCQHHDPISLSVTLS